MNTPTPEPRQSWLTHAGKFYDGTAAEAWFTWIEWVLVTGALYAIARDADSSLFLGLAYFSALLVVLYAATKIEAAVKPLAARTHKVSGALGWLLLIALIIGQLIVMFSMSKVVDAMLSDSIKLN